MNPTEPDIQLIANLVVTDDDGRVLLVRRDLEDDRWWLPGDDLVPYQHPDEGAKQVLNGFPWLAWRDLQMVSIQSFRGRRGWHVMFNYRVSGRGEHSSPGATWFAQDAFPRTMHGRYELTAVQEALAFTGSFELVQP